MFKSLLNFFNPFHGVPGGATKETAALSKGHEKNEKIIDQPPNKDKRLNDTTEPGKEDIITSIPERPTLSVCEIVNEDLVLTDDGHEIPNTESELTDKSEKIDKSNDSSEKRLKRGDNLDQNVKNGYPVDSEKVPDHETQQTSGKIPGKLSKEEADDSKSDSMDESDTGIKHIEIQDIATQNKIEENPNETKKQKGKQKKVGSDIARKRARHTKSVKDIAEEKYAKKDETGAAILPPAKKRKTMQSIRKLAKLRKNVDNPVKH